MCGIDFSALQFSKQKRNLIIIMLCVLFSYAWGLLPRSPVLRRNIMKNIFYESIGYLCLLWARYLLLRVSLSLQVQSFVLTISVFLPPSLSNSSVAFPTVVTFFQTLFPRLFVHPKFSRAICSVLLLHIQHFSLAWMLILLQLPQCCCLMCTQHRTCETSFV